MLSSMIHKCGQFVNDMTSERCLKVSTSVSPNSDSYGPQFICTVDVFANRARLRHVFIGGDCAVLLGALTSRTNAAFSAPNDH